MKRLLFIIIPLIFFGCKNTIAYELRNHTAYDIILVDTKHVDNPEYLKEIIEITYQELK